MGGGGGGGVRGGGGCCLVDGVVRAVRLGVGRIQLVISIQHLYPIE